MLSSKRITLISIVLMAAALIGVIILMANTSAPQNHISKVSYGDGQVVNYTESDYYIDYSKEAFTKISLNGKSAVADSKSVQLSGSNITINGGGIYVLSGKLDGGSITVNAADGMPVRIVLCDAEITSANSPAIYVEQAEKTIISIADGTLNTISDTMQYDDSELDAVIYSRDDLVFNGGGTLCVNACYKDGIKVNDALKIMDGDIRITAADEAISVNDYIVQNGGMVTSESGGDAVKCINNSDGTMGFIAFEGGTINIESQADAIYAGSDIYVNKLSARISCADDALHAERTLLLNDGEIEISKCTEGFEGAYITINDGKYNISSADDALNAKGENSETAKGMPMHMAQKMSGEIFLTINGGTLIACTGGDGIDSNAGGIINGGHIEIYGPENNGNSALDFDGGYEINGGSVIAAGSAAMAQSPAESSKQNTIVVSLDEKYTAESTISLRDENKNAVVSGVSAKSFDWVCISSSEIESGAAYTLYINDEETQTIDVTSSVCVAGNSPFGKRGF